MLAQILKEWRYAKRLSVREAAKLLKINFSTLNRIENNKAISAQTMLHLIKILFDESLSG